ncbi:PREDICTED: uncharacterized protein LOC103608033 isoform X2 [Galeopterus variegatus]|uniref:Uncharacterized protein LOC103608033 isoform X2 n=1 Tax=Galeopterus variegatus TaxID=482537 RepID=A0ABM0SCW1_GALVR|nr:PREDICTED: uncharacterized protein LOC103608033 isoform X2 [Galeopterus variegatus]
MPNLLFSWEEDRKFILRGWSLAFSIVSTLLVLSVLDGRIAYIQGSHTGYLGFWIDCRRHKCASLDQVTVLIHMSKGFMLLALALYLVLLPSMSLSFRPVFRRLNKTDFVFSFLGISIGLLILLSLTLFAINCKMLSPRPQVSYRATFYLCWCASALMLWAGALSYLNQVGMWRKGKWTPFRVRQMSCQRRALRRWAPRGISKQQSSDMDPKHIRNLPNSCSTQSDTSSLSKE